MEQPPIFVSILLPAFIVQSEDDIAQVMKEQLQIPYNKLDLIEIPSYYGNQKEFCIRLKDQDNLCLLEIEKLLNENKRLIDQVNKCKESVKTLTFELQQALTKPAPQQEFEKQKNMKLTKKVKTLKEDNKKLRQLLKSQIANSEKSRQETQTTIETLREEFDILVKELAGLQKKEPNFEEIKGNLIKLTERQLQEQDESYQQQFDEK